MGILFSHNKYLCLYKEFEKIHVNYDFYILAISNLDSNNNNLSEQNINKLKTNAINKIKVLNNNFIEYWKKYDVDYFSSTNIEVLINLIRIKKNMIHQNISKCSIIYDNLVKDLMLEHEIDITIYKT